LAIALIFGLTREGLVQGAAETASLGAVEICCTPNFVELIVSQWRYPVLNEALRQKDWRQLTFDQHCGRA
jgi:hypothetical protein